MAGTTTTSTRTGVAGSDVEALRLEFNKLVTDLETLRAAFMAHTHKTPTTATNATSTPTTDAGGSGSTGGTASTAVATAATLLAAKVGDRAGNTT